MYICPSFVYSSGAFVADFKRLLYLVVGPVVDRSTGETLVISMIFPQAAVEAASHLYRQVLPTRSGLLSNALEMVVSERVASSQAA